MPADQQPDGPVEALQKLDWALQRGSDVHLTSDQVRDVAFVIKRLYADTRFLTALAEEAGHLLADALAELLGIIDDLPAEDVDLAEDQEETIAKWRDALTELTTPFEDEEE